MTKKWRNATEHPELPRHPCGTESHSDDTPWKRGLTASCDDGRLVAVQKAGRGNTVALSMKVCNRAPPVQVGR